MILILVSLRQTSSFCHLLYMNRGLKSFRVGNVGQRTDS